MNTVSWYIYFASLSEGLRPLFGITAGLCIFAGFFCGLFYLLDDDDMSAETRKSLPYYAKRLPLIGAFCILVAVIVPDKNTLYAIGASELGEKIALNSEVQGVASDATKALRHLLQEQIKDDKK
jgi:hypothetical protein